MMTKECHSSKLADYERIRKLHAKKPRKITKKVNTATRTRGKKLERSLK